MFIELIKRKDNSGWIEVICGSIFSGKTEELIRRLKRPHIANRKLAIFKPIMDVRYHETRVVSRDSNFIPSTPLLVPEHIPYHVQGVELVGIDEAQFFDMSLAPVCE